MNLIGGLLKLAKKRNLLSRSEIKLINAFVYGQYSFLKSIVNHFNTKKGNLTWKDVLIKGYQKIF